jgi:hypothetical protein
MSFIRQHPLLSIFFRIALFQQRPDELPASSFLFAVLLVVNLIIGVANFLIDFDIIQSILRTMADLVVSLSFVYGVSAILNCLSFPLLLLLPEVRTSVGVVGVVLYAMFFWHIAIMGHIFRHALSVNLPTGLMISFAYVLMTMAVFYSLFPAQPVQ